ncbi:MAG: hypothetical protein WHS38_05810 [Thermodesulforhabdaceae bacterium]
MVLLENALELKLSLRFMRQLRFCPPPGKVSQEHLKRCPYCQEFYDGEVDLLSEDQTVSSPVSHIVVPSPGQIWKTAEELSGYDEDYRYHNPALVLITEIIDEKIVRVALVHLEECLAFEGDVEVAPSVFAEMWNTFPLPVKYLGKYITSVTLPPVIHFADLAEPPTLVHYYFRKMEAEVAFYFVVKTWYEIIEEYDQDVADLITSQEDYFTVEGAELPENIPDILDRLALASPWDSSMAMAAADRSEELISVNVAVVSDAKISLRTALGYINFRHDDEKGLIIGGRVIGKFSSDAAIHALWKHRDTGEILARAELASFDPEDGFFRLVFPPLTYDDRKNGTIALLVCTRKT